MSFLEVNNYKKKFGDNEVLKGISFTLEKGEVLAIIGSSGGGKTTLLRCLNFLEIPDEGSLSLSGERLFDAADKKQTKEREIRQKRLHFGLVFQSFNLFPQYTVYKNVALAQMLLAKREFRRIKSEFAAEARALPKEERAAKRAEQKKVLADIKNGQKARIAEKTESLLVRVGLSEKRNAYPYELSGGQQQRVAIARALIARPQLVFADEPTGNLDSVSSAEVLSFLRRSVNELGQTIIMVTHDAVAASYADRAIVFADGRIVADETDPTAERMNQLLMQERERATRQSLAPAGAQSPHAGAGVPLPPQSARNTRAGAHAATAGRHRR